MKITNKEMRDFEEFLDSKKDYRKEILHEMYGSEDTDYDKDMEYVKRVGCKDEHIDELIKKYEHDNSLQGRIMRLCLSLL